MKEEVYLVVKTMAGASCRGNSQDLESGRKV